MGQTIILQSHRSFTIAHMAALKWDGKEQPKPCKHLSSISTMSAHQWFWSFLYRMFTLTQFKSKLIIPPMKIYSSMLVVKALCSILTIVRNINVTIHMQILFLIVFLMKEEVIVFIYVIQWSNLSTKLQDGRNIRNTHIHTQWYSYIYNVIRYSIAMLFKWELGVDPSKLYITLIHLYVICWGITCSSTCKICINTHLNMLKFPFTAESGDYSLVWNDFFLISIYKFLASELLWSFIESLYHTR